MGGRDVAETAAGSRMSITAEREDHLASVAHAKSATARIRATACSLWICRQTAEIVNRNKLRGARFTAGYWGGVILLPKQRVNFRLVIIAHITVISP